MVTDNPFDEPVIPLRDLSEMPRAPPILRTHSEGDLHRARVEAAAAGPSGSLGATLAPDMNTGTGGTGSAGTNSPAEVVASAPTRTPRRVQWTQDHVVNLAPMADDPEAQLDHRNIREVNDALERFKKRRPGQRSSLSISSMASDELEHEHGHGHGGHHAHHLHGLGRHHSHGTENGVSDEDYDYRLDHDPPEEEDTDGKDLERTEGELLNQGANDHVTSYVPIGETDGLPSLPTEPDATKEAANLVRSHTGRWGTLRQRVRSGAMKRARKQEEEHREHDNEKEARSSLNPRPQAGNTHNKPNAPSPLHASINPPPGSGLPPIPGGTSVLGTLLQLYNQQNLDSTGTTPASTAPPSRSSSFDEDDEKTLHSASWSERHFPWRRRTQSVDDFGAHKRNDSSLSVADRPHSPDESGFLNSFRGAIGRVRDDRPKAARSGAGVFGALIQNTGAVAAAAAPQSTTLMPSASKRGYHLKRYTLGADSPAGSRPTSLYSHEDSPTSSEFKKSDATVTMQPRESKSSDDLVMMNTKRKSRPVSINLPKTPWMRPLVATPEREGTGDSFFKPQTEEDRKRKEWEAEKRRRKKAKEARRKQEVFIIQHVATIIARQQFLMKLARALMMFGSPSHRLETQIQATARVLEINAQVVYLPGTMLISFADDATHTSETKFMKQDTGLDLGKVLAVHNVYWEVVHDKTSVEDANKELDVLMTSKPYYTAWQTILIGGLCSSFIVVPSFFGSFLDALMCAPLGMLLVSVQILAAKNDMFSNVFEITIATLISFLAAVLGSTSYFCYTALVSGGIVLVLPGYIVLTGALEIASRNITAGAVRIAYSVMYSLFLGFGISIGAEIYIKIRGQSVANADDYTCKNTHYEGAPWYIQTPSGYWYYLCVPMYSMVLSLRNQQPLFRKELPIMVAIACAGWVTNHFAAQAFDKRSDIISALGSFTVGILGNLYGRFLSNGASFPVMVVGILFQLPSGLSQGGLFTFVSEGDKGSSVQYSQGFGVAQQLVSVAIGLTVGLFVSATVMYPLGGSRRRGAGIFSF